MNNSCPARVAFSFKNTAERLDVFRGSKFLLQVIDVDFLGIAD